MLEHKMKKHQNDQNKSSVKLAQIFSANMGPYETYQTTPKKKQGKGFITLSDSEPNSTDDWFNGY